jgi:hypothetical protein
MIRWGICATLAAPPEQVLAFVAHHRAVGAAHLWLHFDDPADPAAELAASLPDVTAIRCDRGWWRRTLGWRPERHQNRQARNLRNLCDAAPLPWLLHIDADEFLLPDRPVADLLAAVPPDRPLARVAPWEALHAPALADDILTARHFRTAMAGEALAGARTRLYGPYAPLLPEGMLGHAAGKCFFRTGIAGLDPRLHGGFHDGRRIAGGGFAPGLSLLHFHAQDPAAWRARLAFRTDRGAYRHNPRLQAFLRAASAAEIDAFYTRVQQATPETLALLSGFGALREARLGLRDAVAALRPPAPPPSSDPRSPAG